MPDILHLLPIPAAPDRLIPLLTRAEGIRQWWTRQASLDREVGGIGEFAFHGGRVLTRVRIEALGPLGLVWRVLDSNAPGGWPGSQISFDLRADAGQTLLHFAHRGLAKADDGFARVNTGWAYYLFSLQKLIETGTGTPH